MPDPASRGSKPFTVRAQAIPPALVAMLFLFPLGGSQWAHAQLADPVVFSFATVGDSRQDPTAPDPTTLLALDPAMNAGEFSLTGTLLPQDRQYLQNSLAWPLIQAGIQSQNPNMLFFNGEMTYGHGRATLPPAWAASGKPSLWTTSQTVSPDAFFAYMQYAYWRGAVAPLFTTGTYVIPVPGDHETQCSAAAAPYSSSAPNPNCDAPGVGNGSGLTAYADNENAFRANLGDLITDLVTNLRFSRVTGFRALNVSGILAGTAPLPSPNNGPILSNQAQLSYSFDIVAAPGLRLHFAIINTDPAGADATAPADWLDADLAAASARGATKLFVFGHKPAFTYDFAAGSAGSGDSAGAPAALGLDANPNHALRDAFWSTIARYRATYFCGHEHVVNVQQYADPTRRYPGTPYQVIVGSGGAPFDARLTGTCPDCIEPASSSPYDRYYAWALVQVHLSGRVSLSVNGFSDSFGPTRNLPQYNVASLQ